MEFRFGVGSGIVMSTREPPSDSGVDAANEALSQLVGRSLSQFSMWGYGLHLAFDGGYLVTVENRLSVTVGDEIWEGDPATAEAAGALLKVVHTDVTSAQVVAGGRLLIETESASIEIPSHEHYESWQLAGPAGLLIVCAPGGAIAVWSGGDFSPCDRD